MRSKYSVKPLATQPPLTFENGLPCTGDQYYKVNPENVLILTGDKNSHGKRDFTGAFRPEAERFRHTHGIPRSNISRIDVSETMLNRGDQTLRAMGSMHNGINILAVFCHGYTSGIQLGVRSPGARGFRRRDRRIWGEFVDLLTAFQNVAVVLYCCSTGSDLQDEETAPGTGDNSFGDHLRDALCKAGCTTNRVFTHTTVGHTTTNPYIKFFEGHYSHHGGAGASYLANPGTDGFRALKVALRDGDFRFRVPFMSAERIHQLI